MSIIADRLRRLRGASAARRQERAARRSERAVRRAEAQRHYRRLKTFDEGRGGPGGPTEGGGF